MPPTFTHRHQTARYDALAYSGDLLTSMVGVMITQNPQVCLWKLILGVVGFDVYALWLQLGALRKPYTSCTGKKDIKEYRES